MYAGGTRRKRAKSCFCVGAGFDEPDAEALAGRAFASGLASIQRNKVSGAGAKYRVRPIGFLLMKKSSSFILSLHLKCPLSLGEDSAERTSYLAIYTHSRRLHYIEMKRLNQHVFLLVKGKPGVVDPAAAGGHVPPVPSGAAQGLVTRAQHP